MAATSLAHFITGLPKAELHVHIEGTLEPELMFKLAKRNNIKLGSKEFPFYTVDDVRKAQNFSELEDFLMVYYQGANVLRTEDDFFELAMAYFERAHQDNVRHIEAFFDPQTHTDRDIPYSTVIEGLSRASQEANQRFGMSVSWIHCFLRHLPEEEAMVSLMMAETYMRNPQYGIIGVGLDSSEVGHPPEKFARVFALAKEMGLRLVAHAGEEGPPEYVQQALDILGVHRIDHGNKSLKDTLLTRRLVDEEMTLTVCPLSNLRLKGVLDLKDHPLPIMLKKGLKVTVNSDDPAYFGGYIVENYLALARRGLIDRADCITLACNSFTGSFLSEERKNEFLTQIDDYAAATPSRPMKGRSRKCIARHAFG
jgi:adenosine deaminase